MIILRAAIQSVFYDYPLEDLLGLILKEKGRDKQFLDDIGKIMSVREEDMNQAIIKQTGALINSEFSYNLYLKFLRNLLGISWTPHFGSCRALS